MRDKYWLVGVAIRNRMQKPMTISLVRQFRVFLLLLTVFFAGCAANIQSGLPPAIQAAVNEDPVLAKGFSAGHAAWQNRDWTKSVFIWEHEYARNHEKYGPDHIATELAGFYLGDSYSRLQNVAKALPLLERASSASARLLGPEHPYTANALDSLTAAYRATDQLELAYETGLKAMQIKKALHGNHSDEFALSSIYLASVLTDLGEYGDALALQRGAYQIWFDVLGPNHVKTVLAMSDIALSQKYLGQYAESLEMQHHALRIRSQLGSEKYDGYFIALSNIASTHEAMGNFSEAIAAHKTALDLVLNKYGADHPITARISSNLGVTYAELGQYALAASTFEEAIRILEISFGKNSTQVAITLENLANVQIKLGKAEDAFASSKRAITIYQATPKVGFRSVGAMQRYANLLRSAGMLDAARATQEDLLAATVERWGENHIETARAKEDLGITLSLLKDHQAAYLLKLDVLRANEAVFGQSNKEVATALINLALDVEFIYGVESAIALNKRAINILQLSRQDVAKVGASELASFTKTLERSYQSLASLLVDQGRLAEAQQVLDMLKEDEQFDFIRRSGDADPRLTRLGYTPTEAKWMNRYNQVAEQLGALGAEEQALQRQAKMGLSPAQLARLKAIKEDLAVANKAFSRFLDEMQKGFAAQGSAKALEVEETSIKTQRELQTLVRQLGPDVGLLQYYVTPDKVGMILNTPGVILPFSNVVDAKVVNRQIFQYRDQLRDPKSNPLPASQALYQLLVAPVAHTLEQAGIKTVMLSLDGNLRHLPFGALHDGKQYMAQRWSMPLYTAVTRNRLRDEVTPRWNTAGLGVTRAHGEFKALPAVKRELDDLLRVTSNNGILGEVYLDDQFTSKRLKDVGQRNFQLMHVSSHFRLSPGTEVNSFLLMGDGQHLTIGDIRTENYRFDQVDLITLSACDTGLGGGRDANGKEIEGLGVIAQQQGAKAVLATLWSVADQSTATLMADMYQRRQTQGLSKIEALRQAQLALMAQPKYSHPFYWAPFILMGNWK